eukprot:g18621.t1
MELSSSVINDFTAELTGLKEEMLSLKQERSHSEQAVTQSSERHTQQIHDLRQELNLRIEQQSSELQELKESKAEEDSQPTNEAAKNWG